MPSVKCAAFWVESCITLMFYVLTQITKKTNIQLLQSLLASNNKVLLHEKFTGHCTTTNQNMYKGWQHCCCWLQHNFRVFLYFVSLCFMVLKIFSQFVYPTTHLLFYYSSRSTSFFFGNNWQPHGGRMQCKTFLMSTLITCLLVCCLTICVCVITVFFLTVYKKSIANKTVNLYAYASDMQTIHRWMDFHIWLLYFVLYCYFSFRFAQ